MVLHLRGTVVVDDEHEVGEAWVVGGRLTFERPAQDATAVLEGWVLPGLVDVHCHIGLASDGPVDDGTAEKQALTNFSSWILRLPRRPTIGCELLVMEQLFTGCKYVKAGIRTLERYLPA